MRLEINILSILPLIKAINNTTSREAILKYFISQRIVSILFLFFFLFATHNFFYLNYFLVIFILFKVGIPPLHTWLSRIILSSPYKIIGLILFVQKFIPLHILSNLTISLNLLFFFVFSTILLTAPALKNLLNLRLAILISAWRNSIWIILSTINSKVWIIFLIFYGMILSFILFLLLSSNCQKFSSLLSIRLPYKVLCIVRFLNLAGLPPFSGFFIKLLLLKNFLGWAPLILIILILNISLMVLFSYLILTYYRLRSNFQSRPAKINFSLFFLLVLMIYILPRFPIFIFLTA